MSETIIGVIQGVKKQDGISKNGKPYERWEFTIGDKRYSTFDEKIGNGFKIGDKIKMEGKRNGKFFNMETMTKFEGQTPDKQEKVPEKAPKGDNEMIIDLLRQILGELRIKNKYERGEILDNGNSKQ